jgi:hypothetical protein
MLLTGFTGVRRTSGDILRFQVVLEKNALPAVISCRAVRPNASLIASPRNFDARKWTPPMRHERNSFDEA